MKHGSVALAAASPALVAAASPRAAASGGTDFALTREILELTDEAARLSVLAYAEDPTSEYGTPDGMFSHPDYDDVHFYVDEPDAGVVAGVGGRCYAAFRGTVPPSTIMGVWDWAQNLYIGEREIYRDGDNTTGELCLSRVGFADFLDADPIVNATDRLLECAAACADPDDCVVITGHSQGGAMAVVASVLLFSLRPIVITFGQPMAVLGGCDSVPSDRTYRYVNYIESGDEDVGFDPVPFMDAFESDHYGHCILLGPSDAATKYVGFDQDLELDPDSDELASGVSAHFVYGYRDRVSALLNRPGQTFPVSTAGFPDGSVCEGDNRSSRTICASGTCVDYACADGVAELCVPGSCREDFNCASGLCAGGACAAGGDDGPSVVGGCPCLYDSDCASGECLQLGGFVCQEGEGGGGSSPTEGPTESPSQSEGGEGAKEGSPTEGPESPAQSEGEGAKEVSPTKEPTELSEGGEGGKEDLPTGEPTEPAPQDGGISAAEILSVRMVCVVLLSMVGTSMG